MSHNVITIDNYLTEHHFKIDWIIAWTEGKEMEVSHTWNSCVAPWSFSNFAHSLADVLSCEDHVAGLTSEAADMPLLLQRQERLTLLDLCSTACAVCIKRVGKERGRWSVCTDCSYMLCARWCCFPSGILPEQVWLLVSKAEGKRKITARNQQMMHSCRVKQLKQGQRSICYYLEDSWLSLTFSDPFYGS